MSVVRAKIAVRGAVQGVGFRPFVYRLANELKLAGSVQNSNSGVDIEVEGEDAALSTFVRRLEAERPPQARVETIECSRLPQPGGFTRFEIRESSSAGSKSTAILPDLATCADCLREIFDPSNRRYLYPFTNCTHCGPRFSIIEAVPYDRASTSMKHFAMCAQCESEYHDARSRRFHAQPNACPACGPTLQLWSPEREVLASAQSALTLAADAIRSGLVVALKGVGGFQLLVDARNRAAVSALRSRKHRAEKPFAVMYPSIAEVDLSCRVSEGERALLLSSQAPIVILNRCGGDVADAVAPRNPRLGVMLPYSPLHHILMQALSFPIVATSGNISDEPICIDEREALDRLRKIADLFLVHNRPIVRHVDDSIVQVVAGREMMLRRARGYSPLPLRMNTNVDGILAVGAHLKNTVALGIGREVFVSQHIGNLETETAVGAFQTAASDLPRLYEAKPRTVAHDLHPDYASTRYAQACRASTIGVQHHYAHVLACMAEHHLQAPVLGVAWDGTGLGTDGKIWGGEFLRVTDEGFERVAHLREFRLPGGDICVKDIRRSAMGMLYEFTGPRMFEGKHALQAVKHLMESFSDSDLRVIAQMLQKNLNAPVTSSAGRLFDGIAALIGLRHNSTFEGQAAMELEFNITPEITDSYSFAVHAGSPSVIDWEPVIRDIIDDLALGKTPGDIAAKFHNGLVDAIVQIAERAGERRIALTGGCFQNRYLLETSVRALRARGFDVYWPQEIPANDGGIALGQVIAAGRANRNSGMTAFDADGAIATMDPVTAE